MNILSVMCLITLALYLLIVLAFNQRGNGRQLFRTVYSAIVLGVLGGVFLYIFESLISDVSPAIAADDNILRSAYGFLMLLIPLDIIIIMINILMKKKRPALLLIISAAIDVLACAGVAVFVGLGDKYGTNALSTVLLFILIYLPYLLGFAVFGLLKGEQKYEKGLIEAAMYVQLAASLVYLVIIGIALFSLMQIFGLASLIVYVPLLLAWLAIPAVPLIMQRRFKNKDAERNGEEIKKFRLFKKKK